MRVTGAGYTPFIEKTYADSKKPADKTEERKTSAGRAMDRLEISKESRDMKGYARGIKAERIESLRQVVAKGEYQVSSEELADAIMRRMTER
jgi:flagellar biosynthesis anti-sigma factor FlgM